MQNFVENFRRNRRGAWICVTPAEFKGPNGSMQISAGSRFARGNKFAGIDVAEVLDAYHEKYKRKVCAS